MFLKALIQCHPLVKVSKVVYYHSKKTKQNKTQDLAIHAKFLGNGSLLQDSFPREIMYQTAGINILS